MIKKGVQISFRRLFNGSNVYNFAKPKSYYEILDIKPTATQKELRSQFLKKGKNNS